MNKRWMAAYAAAMGLASLGCVWGLGDGYSGGDDWYSAEHSDDPPTYDEGDGYHGRDAVRQALTAEAPQVDNDGYSEDGSYWDCEVHAQCPRGEVCASDPACPDYLYCYPADEALCDCADRFNTVCYFGECVMRGVSCDTGCPAGTTCDENVGACVCEDEGCMGPAAAASTTEEPEADQQEAVEPNPPGDGEKCLSDADCSEGMCVDGVCGAVPCWDDIDCNQGQVCAEASDGLTYCFNP